MNVYSKIPKIELHVHLEGAIPLESLWKLIIKYGGDPSISTFNELQNKFIYKDFDSFIDAWSWKNQLLKEYEDFTFIAEQVAQDFSSQNIRYSEVFISPSLFKKYNLNTQEIIYAINKGLRKVESINIQLIIDLVRDYGPDNELITLHEINEVKEYGIIGIGIGGTEHTYPPELFHNLFIQARKYGFFTNAHAGEASGPESIWGAINSLNVNRIGHGTNSIHDKSLLSFLSDHKIPLELCPLSNVKTNLIKTHHEFPLLTFIEYGIPFSINTDDPKMFGNSLAEEYQMIEKSFNFSFRDICTMIINSIQSTWLPSKEKLLLQKQFQHEMNCIIELYSDKAGQTSNN